MRSPRSSAIWRTDRWPPPSAPIEPTQKASDLYFAARFDECIDACRNIEASAVQERSELALLAARSMLRLERCVEADNLLLASAANHTTLDAKLTSSMLIAFARARRGLPDEALEILNPLVVQARAAHPSVQSEIELVFAYAHFAKSDLPAALDRILRVKGDSEIIHARALELQALCYERLGKRRDAATSFVAALVRLDSCRRQDLGLSASAIAGLSRVSAQLTDVALMRVVENRYSTMQWPPSAEQHRYDVEANLAFHAVFTGDLKKAAAFALRSLESASSEPMVARSNAQLANIARLAGDRFFAQIYLEAAWRSLDAILGGEIDAHWQVLDAALDVIAATSVCDAIRARKLFTAYRNQLSAQPYDGDANHEFLRARERYVQGLICQAEQSITLAKECLKHSYDLFCQADSAIHALQSAYALAVLGDDSMYWYVFGALAGITNWMTQGLKCKGDAGLSAAELNEHRRVVLANLTQSQREVVNLVCAGRSNPDIARLRKTTVQTVKNMLSSHIFPAFGVATRLELKSAVSDLTSAGLGAGSSPNTGAAALAQVRKNA